ncbi:MAG: response regulator [Acidobacteriota bacterium]|nr:response regulator [Acidobacteriota bacterium]
MDTRKTILLIEDNPDLRAAIGDALESLGYEVIVAAGSAPALEIARDASFDLVLVNAYPDRGRGLETVDQVRRLAPGIPAVLGSGFGDDLDLRQRVETGDVGFLRLPFSLDGLARAIEHNLDRQTPRDPDPEIPVPLANSGQGARSYRFQPWLAAAAGLVFVLGLVLRFGAVTPVLPPPELDSTSRGASIHLLEPVGKVPGTPSHLVWRDSPGAVLYKVVLMTVDETVLWQTETQAALVEIPQWLVEELHPSVTYHWQVEGFDENRSLIGESEFAAFSRLGRLGG